jgi:hypothetical protein
VELIASLAALALEQLVELGEVGVGVGQLAGVDVGEVLVGLRLNHDDLVGALAQQEVVGVELSAPGRPLPPGWKPYSMV